ncbi:hypothetical protein EIN_469810 [Entamoeba invadens IP1]|uniref:Uncharacterized protein n=1 Tax=Entamoeba invadens IP1 TaxID=370355 RepID=A0A0A1TUK9_ENTIV|nr:hypothetical protein EIN_469810 [Entamoeba invadens IP1]ELP83757.1 hypothetical protein EIN_469810 [Entamoeba invadens IP1]|eukprot:XP_004183103.1 hypothetical protein EIN_469810 [Entamoeba invadens IP1]
MSDKTKEFSYLILQYLQSQTNKEIFLMTSALLKLYFSKEYVIELTKRNDLEKLQMYLRCFVNHNDFATVKACVALLEYQLCAGCIQNDIEKIVAVKREIEALENPKSLLVTERLNKIKAKISMGYSVYNDLEVKPITENPEKYRAEQLGNVIVAAMSESKEMTEKMVFPSIIPDQLKRLVSNGIRYDHIVKCGGKPKEKIVIESFLNNTHTCGATSDIDFGTQMGKLYGMKDTVTALHAEGDIVHIGYKSGVFQCYDLSQNRVCLQDSFSSEIVSVDSSLPCFIVAQSTKVKVYLEGNQRVSVMCEIKGENVQKVGVMRGRTEIVVLDNKRLKIYSNNGKVLLFSSDGVLDFVFGSHSCCLKVVKGDGVYSIFGGFGKKYEEKTEKNIPSVVSAYNGVVSTQSKFFNIQRQNEEIERDQKTEEKALFGGKNGMIVRSKSGVFLKSTEGCKKVKGLDDAILLSGIDNIEVGYSPAQNCVEMFTNTVECIISWSDLSNSHPSFLVQPSKQGDDDSVVKKSEEIPPDSILIKKEVAPETKKSVSHPLAPSDKPQPNERVGPTQDILHHELKRQDEFPHVLNPLLQNPRTICNGQNLMVECGTVSGKRGDIYIYTKSSANELFVYKKTVNSFKQLNNKNPLQGSHPTAPVCCEVTRSGLFLLYSNDTKCVLFKLADSVPYPPFPISPNVSGMVSKLAFFPNDANLILIGTEDNPNTKLPMFHVYQATNGFRSQDYLRTQHFDGKVVGFYFPECDKNAKKIPFCVINQKGIVLYSIYDKESHQNNIQAGEVKIKEREGTVFMTFSGGKFLYLVENGRITQIDTEKWNVTKELKLDKIVCACISNDRKNILVLTETVFVVVNPFNFETKILDMDERLLGAKWVCPIEDSMFVLAKGKSVLRFELVHGF